MALTEEQLHKAARETGFYSIENILENEIDAADSLKEATNEFYEAIHELHAKTGELLKTLSDAR